MAFREFRTFADALKSPEKVRRLYVIVTSKRTRLPDFRLFPELEELTLCGHLAHVTAFPTVFDCLKLRAFTFTGSSMTRIPRGFARLQKLETLVLEGHRKLKALPEDVVDLPRLRRMRIDHNGLTKLPANLGRLTALQELIAYNNALGQLPPSLFGMKKLRWLELQCNSLAKPPLKLMTMRLEHLQTDFEAFNRSRS